MAIIGDEEGRTLTKSDQRREVKMMLRRALIDMNVKMVSDRDYDSVGLQYTDEFASYLEVLSAMSLLPWHQRVALVRNLGPERALQEVIARDMHVCRQSVCTYINDGLREMCSRIYGQSGNPLDKQLPQSV